MEKLFENKTKYSQKDYDIFIEAYKNEFAKSDYVFILFNIVFFGLCMILAFREKEIFLGLAILIGLGLYLWFRIIRQNLIVEKTKKSQKVLGDFENNYEFYKNYFKVKNKDGEAQIFYLNLYRTIETKEFFYIFISRQYAFIISKQGFIKGTAEEFASFIKKKMPIKYKIRTKK